VFLEEGLSPGPEDFVSMEGMLRNGFQKPTKNPLRKRKGGFFNLKPETRNLFYVDRISWRMKTA